MTRADKTPEEIEEFLKKLIRINYAHLREEPQDHPYREQYLSKIEAYENVLYFMGIY